MSKDHSSQSLFVPLPVFDDAVQAKSSPAFKRSASYTFYATEEPNLMDEVDSSPFKEQINEVKKILLTEKLIHASRIEPEVDWFYLRLGIDSYYFKSTPANIIARHILSLYSAKMVSHATGNKLEIQLFNKTEENATFICPSNPGQQQSQAMSIEPLIETQFLGDTMPTTQQNLPPPMFSQGATPPPPPPHGYRVACYRTTGTVSSTSDTHLRLYFLSRPVFPTSTASESESDLEKVSDIYFLKRSGENTKKWYQEVMTEAVKSLGPVIRVYDYGHVQCQRLVIAFRRGSANSYWSAMSNLYHYYGLYSTHKFIEQFSNGITICTMYLTTLKEADLADLKSRMQLVAEQASLIYVLPRTEMTPLFTAALLNAEETAYAYVVWKFSFQFLNRYATEYEAIAKALSKDPAISSLLAQLKTRLTKDTFTESRVRDAIMQHPQLIKDLFADFDKYHGPSTSTERATYDKLHGGDILQKIQKATNTELDVNIFTAILAFNRHVLKTNFFQQSKVALSFRLDPAFLANNYTDIPFGLFFIVGSEFRGFHVRFRDIARGGIRIIRSANATTYDQNSSAVFDENYNLASTQQAKNKDIPEGGSKGTILLTKDSQTKADVAFRKYIDSLLDVLLPKKEMVDFYGKQEILFCGPDEGTADYMDWASSHARARGYSYWKAFTTGKSPKLGGVPHDLNGVTTKSVHQYVLGTLEKLGLSESACSKFQTGGPDGDLGSNEIKISTDKTIGIVDGSGVLFDPVGINREELLRLANKRVMGREFDKSKLSAKGFFVDVSANDITLPDGTPVVNGMTFRNNFHLNSLSTADVFVPCGGRPEAVNLSNVESMFHANGEPRFKIVVEGANLFFTQKARLMLEEKGVIVFKDSSANKGGVTSSSLEVFAALALNDEEFLKNMAVDNMKEQPEFYRAYTKDICDKIEDNARREFECIWREHQKSNVPRCIITDDLSRKINELNDAIQSSTLWDNAPLRTKILSDACPKTLLNLVGLDKIVQRVPETYMRAIFGANLASRFVYENGLSSPEFAFYTFVTKYMQ